MDFTELYSSAGWVSNCRLALLYYRYRYYDRWGVVSRNLQFGDRQIRIFPSQGLHTSVVWRPCEGKMESYGRFEKCSNS